MTAEHWKAYPHHMALNAGQAVRDIRYLTNHPDADDIAPVGSARHVFESVKRRVPSFAYNVLHAVLPPADHSVDDLKGMRRSSVKQWLLAGYKPWEYKVNEDDYDWDADKPKG